MDNNEKDKAEATVVVSSEKIASRIESFFEKFGGTGIIPPNCNSKDFYSHLIKGILKVQTIQSSKISCFLTVVPAVTNVYGGMHGGAVAAVAEIISSACVRTVVAKDKPLFLGELSMSYLSAAPGNSEVIVEASLVRSGRNISVVSVEFRRKESNQLVYTSRATFYHLPVSSL